MCKLVAHRQISDKDSPRENHRCKVPFRYNRVNCKVRGDKTVQELVVGDTFETTMEFVGGTWKLLEVDTTAKE